MSEQLREYKVSLYVDTNKQRIQEDFESVQELIDYIPRLEIEGLSDLDKTGELLESVDAEIEKLKASEYMQLTDGWTQSRHYQEGHVAGQLWILLHIKDMLEVDENE